ncbi:hypothetical protein F53441_12896 [Fusarium austroafricanum]|uniref:Uncharacterized protein n=1 Tax=Fusarium austroafricanum TaxID=2364996 RepID=A0A8H4JU07_9HYPO|nr:hypothetical protein F53441_12896 [Fusarium austroafricanum]
MTSSKHNQSVTGGDAPPTKRRRINYKWTHTNHQLRSSQLEDIPEEVKYEASESEGAGIDHEIEEDQYEAAGSNGAIIDPEVEKAALILMGMRHGKWSAEEATPPPTYRYPTTPPGDTEQDTVMSLRQAAVQKDFSLRPGSRPFVKNQLPGSMEEDEPSSLAETNVSYPAGSPAQDASDDDRSSTSDSDSDEPNDPKTKLPKQPYRYELQHDGEGPERPPSPEMPTLPPHFPPCPIDRPTSNDIALWLEGCLEIQRRNGSVRQIDVVHWMATRRGGFANPRPIFDEAQEAIEIMRNETIDMEAIRHRQQEEEEIARLKEERRQRNKRRYRPRGQIEREKAERLAARQSQQDLEMVRQGSDTSAAVDKQEEAVDDIEEARPKKEIIDAGY